MRDPVQYKPLRFSGPPQLLIRRAAGPVSDKSGLFDKPDRVSQPRLAQDFLVQTTKTPLRGGVSLVRQMHSIKLFDLGFLEFDVLANNRIVLAERELFGRGTGVLLGNVVKAGVGGRNQLDLDRVGLCHRGSL